MSKVSDVVIVASHECPCCGKDASVADSLMISTEKGALVCNQKCFLGMNEDAVCGPEYEMMKHKIAGTDSVLVTVVEPIAFPFRRSPARRAARDQRKVEEENAKAAAKRRQAAEEENLRRQADEAARMRTIPTNYSVQNLLSELEIGMPVLSSKKLAAIDQSSLAPSQVVLLNTAIDVLKALNQ